MKKEEKSVIKLFEEAKSRFLEKNKEHKSVFFIASRESIANTVWLKWMHVAEYLNKKLSFSEVRKHLLDLAIYSIMLIAYEEMEVNKVGKSFDVYMISNGVVKKVDKIPAGINCADVNGMKIAVDKNKVYIVFPSTVQK